MNKKYLTSKNLTPTNDLLKIKSIDSNVFDLIALMDINFIITRLDAESNNVIKIEIARVFSGLLISKYWFDDFGSQDDSLSDHLNDTIFDIVGDLILYCDYIADDNLVRSEEYRKALDVSIDRLMIK